MRSVKVAITIDPDTLARVDGLVSRSVFANRSKAIQSAVAEKLARMERGRLASECAKLDPALVAPGARAETGRVLRKISVASREEFLDK